MRIYIGSDHAGYKMKEDLQMYLKKNGHEAVDLGCFNESSTDYPDIAHEVADKVSENPGALGILVCGTGIGMSMVANVVPSVRAAVCTSPEMAEMSRQHNDANILCLGARIIDADLAKKIVDKFLVSEFESHEERHVRRVAKIEKKKCQYQS